MRIIHLVLGKANPERMNGVNKVAFNLASTQSELGWEVTLWGIANTLEVNYPARNFNTRIFQQLKNKLKIDESLKMAMTKNKLVKKIYFEAFESKLIQDAKYVQLLGINEFKYLDQLTQRANKCLIPNGQDLKTIYLSPQKKRTSDAPVFGFCGRLATFHKGLDLMLEGFQRYIYLGGEGTLELIGDSDERADLEKLANDLGITEYVIFHGKKFGKEMHTSRMEGFPTAVLEAAGMKIPTITSDATNINSFVVKHQSGFILEKNTPEEIAQVMTTAAQQFSENKLKAMGERGRRMVKQDFDWKVIAEKLVEVYTS